MSSSDRVFECTYTKHKTQKRKMYHDGYLVVQRGSKAVLYDHLYMTAGNKCTSLETRFVQNIPTPIVANADDLIEFEAFLVQIGEDITHGNSNNNAAYTFSS